MRLHRIRKIVTYPDGSFCLGLSLPVELADKWLDKYVYVYDKDNMIILSSGALPVSFQLKDIKTHIKVAEKIKI